MTFRITRSKFGGRPKDRQGYYLEASHEQEAIARFFQKYPQYLGEQIDLQKWSD